MTVKQLRAFLAVAQSLSFAQAGERWVFASELKAIAADLPGLSMQIFQSGVVPPPSMNGFVVKAGRISPSDVLAAASGGSQFHVCGPSGLVTEIADALGRRGSSS